MLFYYLFFTWDFKNCNNNNKPKSLVTLDIWKLIFMSSKIFKSFIKVTIIDYEKVNRSK